MIKKIIYKLLGMKYKEEILEYPREFAIVDYSSIAKQEGITDEQNKIILRYYIDEFGNRKVKKYEYSAPRLHAIKETYQIPILDKTINEQKLAVFGNVLPSELEFSI